MKEGKIDFNAPLVDPNYNENNFIKQHTVLDSIISILLLNSMLNWKTKNLIKLIEPLR